MATPHVSKDTVRALAAVSGLNLSDEKLEQLLPQVQQTVETMVELDKLDLESVEPAIVFKSERG